VFVINDGALVDLANLVEGAVSELAPVFEAMLEKAMRLCEAAFGTLGIYDGETFRTAATRGVPDAYAEYRSRNPPVFGHGTGPARMLAGERVVHNIDLKDEDAYRNGEPNRRALVDIGGARTARQVALLKDGAVLGYIIIYRTQVRPFTERQIALLQNFAAQVVIAMENARLLTETREALEQQTATAWVLQVINSSPGDLAPVFDAMLEKAMRLCGAAFGELRTYDGERFNLAAVHGVPSSYVDYYRAHNTGIYGSGTGPTQLLGGKALVHIPDLTATEPYQQGDPDRRALVDLGGGRSYLMVPLLRNRTVLGYIMIYRKEPGPIPTSRSRYCKTSQRRPSSRWRTRGS
jgi:GAF domain-containing protein